MDDTNSRQHDHIRQQAAMSDGFLPKQIVDQIYSLHARKVGMILPFSAEMINPRPLKVKSVTPPTKEELAEYKTWKREFKKLRQIGYDRGWYSEGGPEYGPEFEPPRNTYEYEEETTGEA